MQTSDEKKITEANTGAFIQECDLEALRGLLLYLFSLCGVLPSNYPLEADKTVLIDFIVSNYPTFRIPEVRLAFQMAISGKLYDADGKQIEHYQNFSPAYFGKVMTAFRKKSQDLKLYQQQAREWNKEPEKISRYNEIPDEEMVGLSFANYLKLGNWQLIYPLCYDCLKRHGYGVTIEEGTRQRALFNRVQHEGGMVPESRERMFKQWLCAAIFEEFKNQGKTEIRL